MKKADAEQVVLEYAVAFAVYRAKTEVEDAIEAQPYDSLGWYSMLDVYAAVRNRLQEQARERSFYFWSQAGVDQNKFQAAMYMLGEDYAAKTIANILTAFTTDTLEAFGQAKLEAKRKEGKRENVDDWIPVG